MEQSITARMTLENGMLLTERKQEPLFTSKDCDNFHDIKVRASLRATHEGREPVEVRAARYLEKHPEVYEEFKRFAWEAVMAGVTRMSADMVAHRVRWESSVVKKGTAKYRVNNNCVAAMARRFMEENPKCAGVFETRTKKAK